MLTALAILVAPWVLYIFNADIETGRSICPTWNLFGVMCPGCGMTRSLVVLYQGRLLDSFSYNLFGPLLAVMLATVVVAEAIGGSRVRAFVDRVNYSSTFWLTVIIIAVLYGVARNFNT